MFVRKPTCQYAPPWDHSPAAAADSSDASPAEDGREHAAGRNAGTSEPSAGSASWSGQWAASGQFMECPRANRRIALGGGAVVTTAAVALVVLAPATVPTATVDGARTSPAPAWTTPDPDPGSPSSAGPSPSTNARSRERQDAPPSTPLAAPSGDARIEQEGNRTLPPARAIDDPGRATNGGGRKRQVTSAAAAPYSAAPSPHPAQVRTTTPIQAAALRPRALKSGDTCTNHVPADRTRLIAMRPGDVVCVGPAKHDHASSDDADNVHDNRARTNVSDELENSEDQPEPQSRSASDDERQDSAPRGSWTIRIPWFPIPQCMTDTGAVSHPSREITICGTRASTSTVAPLEIGRERDRESANPSEASSQERDDEEPETASWPDERTDTGSDSATDADPHAESEAGGLVRRRVLPARWPIPPQIRQRLTRTSGSENASFSGGSDDRSGR